MTIESRSLETSKPQDLMSVLGPLDADLSFIFDKIGFKQGLHGLRQEITGSEETDDFSEDFDQIISELRVIIAMDDKSFSSMSVQDRITLRTSVTQMLSDIQQIKTYYGIISFASKDLSLYYPAFDQSSMPQVSLDRPHMISDEQIDAIHSYLMESKIKESVRSTIVNAIISLRNYSKGLMASFEDIQGLITKYSLDIKVGGS